MFCLFIFSHEQQMRRPLAFRCRIEICVLRKENWLWMNCNELSLLCILRFHVESHFRFKVGFRIACYFCVHRMMFMPIHTAHLALLSVIHLQNRSIPITEPMAFDAILKSIGPLIIVWNLRRTVLWMNHFLASKKKMSEWMFSLLHLFENHWITSMHCVFTNINIK